MKPIIALLLAAVATPALAQSTAQPALTQRVDRIEKELRAVQRKVFPGVSQAPGYLEPEIAPAAPTTANGIPATAPIADLTARVNSLEQEMARMTGQLEQNSFKLRQLDEQVARLRAESDARLDAAAGASTAGAPPAASPPRGATPPRATTPPRETVPAETPAAEVAPPPSADPGEDAYLAAYRLWAAKNYDAAESMLKEFIAKYPKHKRVSYAQNLLGRTYLDSNRPAAAAVAFHKNYTTNPRGERAPDSLYFLGQSLMKLDKPVPAKACESYETLLREYGSTIGADLKAKVAKAQVDAKCSK